MYQVIQSVEIYAAFITFQTSSKALAVIFLVNQESMSKSTVENEWRTGSFLARDRIDKKAVL